jgi:hypothetical protein
MTPLVMGAYGALSADLLDGGITLGLSANAKACRGSGDCCSEVGAGEVGAGVLTHLPGLVLGVGLLV